MVNGGSAYVVPHYRYPPATKRLNIHHFTHSPL